MENMGMETSARLIVTVLLTYGKILVVFAIWGKRTR